VVHGLAGRYLDDANEIRLGNTWWADVRVSRRVGPFSVRLDIKNVTGARYVEVGYTLTDFRSGEPVPYFFPAPGLAARIGLVWEEAGR
jgi:outer membrane receptor protein involved in Fe transport